MRFKGATRLPVFLRGKSLDQVIQAFVWVERNLEMKTTQKLLTVLALVLGFGSAHAAPVFVQLATGNGDLHFDSHNWGTQVYANASFKINDRYSITPEALFEVKYDAKDASFFSFQHKFIRVVLNDKKLAKFGAWNLAMSYRYNLPTDLGSQAAGNLGGVLLRPALSNKFGRFNFKVRDGVNFNLIRNAYQVNPTGPTAKGNSLLSNNLELIFGTDVTPVMDVGLVLVSGQSLRGAARGSTGTSWNYSSSA